MPNASTVGRNTLRTGGTNNFDLNLTKSISFGERRRIELRWEALNAFNHPTFAVSDQNINSQQFGKVTSLATISRERGKVAAVCG